MIYKVRPKAVKTEAIHWLGNTTDFSNLNELLGDRPDYLKKYQATNLLGHGVMIILGASDLWKFKLKIGDWLVKTKKSRFPTWGLKAYSDEQFKEIFLLTLGGSRENSNFVKSLKKS